MQAHVGYRLDERNLKPGERIAIDEGQIRLWIDGTDLCVEVPSSVVTVGESNFEKHCGPWPTASKDRPWIRPAGLGRDVSRKALREGLRLVIGERIRAVVTTVTNNGSLTARIQLEVPDGPSDEERTVIETQHAS